MSLRLVFLLTIFRVLNSINAVTKTREQVPLDYHLYPRYNRAYKVHTEELTWAEAKQKCNEEGADLAVIDTYDKVHTIAAIKPHDSYVWVGISRESPNHSWLTVDGFSLPFIPWAPDIHLSEDDCLAVTGRSRGLINAYCTNGRSFVCEIVMSN